MTRIAIASGKGGTGKTTVATSLALALAAQPARAQPPLFLDCDVEAPNAHLFLKPEIQERRPVGVLIPKVDMSLCSHCGKCAEVCQFHAIAVLGCQTLVFPQLCHGCGSCTLVCPERAITEVEKNTGFLERGITTDGIQFGRGVMNVGEPMAVPIINHLKRWLTPEPGQDVILDAPPGTSCPVVATMLGCDTLILVTEPTPFGLHDLKLAYQVARQLDIPSGVIINRNQAEFAEMDDFCQQAGLPVLMRIPFDRAIAEGVAQGYTLMEIYPQYISLLQQMVAQLASPTQGWDLAGKQRKSVR